MQKYNKIFLDHFNNPRNIGSMDENNVNVGTGIVGSPQCGDVMKVQILVADNKIKDIKFKTFGCGAAIASSSLATEKIKGYTLEKALKLDNKDLVRELDLPEIKIHCSVLVIDAVKEAVKDYQNKHS